MLSESCPRQPDMLYLTLTAPPRLSRDLTTLPRGLTVTPRLVRPPFSPPEVGLAPLVVLVRLQRAIVRHDGGDERVRRRLRLANLLQQQRRRLDRADAQRLFTAPRFTALLFTAPQRCRPAAPPRRPSPRRRRSRPRRRRTCGGGTSCPAFNYSPQESRADASLCKASRCCCRYVAGIERR